MALSSLVGDPTVRGEENKQKHHKSGNSMCVGTFLWVLWTQGGNERPTQSPRAKPATHLEVLQGLYSLSFQHSCFIFVIISMFDFLPSIKMKGTE